MQLTYLHICVCTRMRVCVYVSVILAFFFIFYVNRKVRLRLKQMLLAKYITRKICVEANSCGHISIPNKPTAPPYMCVFVRKKTDYMSKCVFASSEMNTISIHS